MNTELLNKSGLIENADMPAPFVCVSATEEGKSVGPFVGFCPGNFTVFVVFQESGGKPNEVYFSQ